MIVYMIAPWPKKVIYKCASAHTAHLVRLASISPSTNSQERRTPPIQMIEKLQRHGQDLSF